MVSSFYRPEAPLPDPHSLEQTLSLRVVVAGGWGRGGDGDGEGMESDFLSSLLFPHALFPSRVSGGCRQLDFSCRDLDGVHGSCGTRAGGV